MKFRSLALVPVLFAGVFSIAALLAGEGLLPAVLTVENEAGKTIAALGCVAAALAFERGDYLRRAWAFSAVCYALLLLGDLAGLPVFGAHLGAGAIVLVQGLLAVVANATSVAGTWMLASAWTVAGLDDDEGPRRRRRLLFGAATVLALAITGWSLVHDVGALARGDVGALVSIASDVGDTICFALVAPVLQTALALRGGVLRWPWGFLTAGGLAWIVYDAASGVAGAAHAGSASGLVGTEAVRALACGYFLTAGLAQRLAVAPDVRLSIPG
jgi:hypothetical protein